MNQYILDRNNRPQIEHDQKLWVLWMAHAPRTVAEDTVHGVLVRTVFLGLDHNHLPSGPPVLWETKVFKDPAVILGRCAGSVEQAEAMHQSVCRAINSSYENVFRQAHDGE